MSKRTDRVPPKLVEGKRRLPDGYGATRFLLELREAAARVMTIEQAIEAEAQAQAIRMMSEDFSRAFNAVIARRNKRLANI